MHGAGEQNAQPQQQQQPRQQQPRYRYTSRNEEQNQQPSTSAQPATARKPIQASIICTPTTASSSPATPIDNSSNSSQRSKPTVVRMRDSIKIGDTVLEPAGTLVFSQSESPTWSGAQRIVVHGNKHAVVQANLFPIGPPVLTVQAPTQSSNGNWLMNQQSTASINNSSIGAPANSLTSTSAATPDSGIQSVPTSPPSPSFELLNVREADTFDNDDLDDDDPEDFTDMPCLKPVDEEDDCYDMPSTSSGPILTESNTSTTSPKVHLTATSLSPKEELPNSISAEEFLSSSLASKMDPDEIVRRLFAAYPDQANTIAMLIRKRSAEESKKKKDMEAEVSSTTPSTPRARCTRKRNRCATRNTNSPDVTTSNLPEEPSTSSAGTTEGIVESNNGEGRKRGRKQRNTSTVSKGEVEEDNATVKKTKIDSEEQRESSTTLETASSRQENIRTDPVQFRLKIHEMMDRQLETVTEQMRIDMSELRLCHSTTSKILHGKRKDSFFRQLNEQSKKLRKNGVPVLKKKRMFGFETTPSNQLNVKKEIKMEMKEDIAPFKTKNRLSSRRSRVEDSPEVVLAPVDEKFNGEYYEISKSVAYSEGIIPLWRAPSLSCGCTRGACTSDMECLNRALRVQCSSDCSLSYCSNRRFWKEDCGNKLCVSTGPKSKRVLRTKVGRKAGEFLSEYAGEVIDNEMAQRRFKVNQDMKIISIGAQLYIDATTRGNTARFIKHSCKPNSRIEVWSVNGCYRAGIFALVDMSPNVEITVDKNGLIPFMLPCCCGVAECRGIIRGVRRAALVNEDEHESLQTRRFLQRNRKKTILTSRQSGLPSILLLEDNSSLLLNMKKVLAAFSFRVRRTDGSMPRSMLPYYTAIQSYLKVKSTDSNSAEFVSLFRKWLEKIDDDDLERAFVAIESHYLSFSKNSSAQPAKKSEESAPRGKAAPPICHSPGLPKRGDADLSYLDSLHPIGSYDPDDAWESYKANTSDNAVRCMCGALDEDGEMVQCDKCDFWLHMDCCEIVNAESDFICEFCDGKLVRQRPTVDVKLPEQPEVRFENCDYYRSLINRRGIQVRLNETVYINRAFNEDHKAILKNLREEKKGVKHKEPNKYTFPEAETDPLPSMHVDRKDARIFRVERLFVCPGNNRYVFGSFYAWPHETYADTGRVFCKKEVFATSYYETLPLDEVIGRCLVVDQSTWCEGRPKVPKFKEDDVFFCEMQIGRNQRVFEKIPPRHKYPINTKPYVFTKFSQPKKVVRDLKPYDPKNVTPKQAKPHASSSSASPNISSSLQSSSDPFSLVVMKTLSEKNIQRVLKHLRRQSS